MSNRRIFLIIFLHLMLITVIPAYYWKIFFPESQDKLFPRILADIIILSIVYFSIKKGKIPQPKAMKIKSNLWWFLISIFTAALFNSGVYGADFMSGIVYFWPSMDVFQKNILVCIAFDDASNGTIYLNIINKIYYLVWIAISAAVCEEYIYRRLVLNHFRKYGVFLALVISSVIFEFVHFERFHALYFFHVALWFGVLYVLSGKVWVSMVAHFVYNAFHDVQLIFFQTKLWPFFVWIYPVCYVFCTAWVIYYLAILGFATIRNRISCVVIHMIVWLGIIVAGIFGYNGLYILDYSNC